MNNNTIKFRIWSKILNDFYKDLVWLGIDGKELIFVKANKEGQIIQLTGEHYIIQQFTGFTDLNNQEIYEGDILLEAGCDKQLEIIRQPSGLWIADSKDGYCDYVANIHTKCVVIGNIFGVQKEKQKEIIVYES